MGRFTKVEFNYAPLDMKQMELHRQELKDELARLEADVQVLEARRAELMQWLARHSAINTGCTYTNYDTSDLTNILSETSNRKLQQILGKRFPEPSGGGR